MPNFHSSTINYNSFIIQSMIQMQKFNSRYALTFGQMPYTHDGLEEGKQKIELSYSVADLQKIHQRLLTLDPPIESKIIYLHQNLPEGLQTNQTKSAVLYIPGMVNYMLEDQNGANKMYEQQEALEYDKKYYDHTMKKTFNRKARYHMIFGNTFRQASEDFKQYTIQDFGSLKYLSLLRIKLGEYFYIDQKITQQYIENYYAEGVHYYNDQSGLGFHGDDGRLVVIGVCLGRTTTLCYCWRKPFSSNNDSFPPIDIEVKHGDIYIMSQKATGNDWKKRSKFRVVHAAGAQKFVNV